MLPGSTPTRARSTCFVPILNLCPHWAHCALVSSCSQLLLKNRSRPMTGYAQLLIVANTRCEAIQSSSRRHRGQDPRPSLNRCPTPVSFQWSQCDLLTDAQSASEAPEHIKQACRMGLSQSACLSHPDAVAVVPLVAVVAGDPEVVLVGDIARDEATDGAGIAGSRSSSCCSRLVGGLPFALDSTCKRMQQLQPQHPTHASIPALRHQVRDAPIRNSSHCIWTECRHGGC